MTKREAENRYFQQRALMDLGFTYEESEALRRISMTLHRWSEHECNGAIQRDGDNGDGVPYWYNTNTGRKICRVADRERGAMKRLQAIVDTRNARIKPTDGDTRIDPVGYYVQGDPRGCSLYILRPGDVPEGADAHGYYTRGIAVA